MDTIRKLVVRDTNDSDNTPITPSMFKLLVALLALVLIGLFLIAILFFIRRRKNARRASLLPVHEEKPTRRISNHRRLTITATPFDAHKESIYVYNEKRDLEANSSSPPASPVPEIRITFPDEEDHTGRRKSGRVVLVRLSEGGSVGMEPCAEEHLPPYSADSDRFHSLDLDRMGGLREKDDRRFG
ncbi:MAG: hypothetical protein Q9227_007731 [Pyrenula ochraceoflavens]